MSEAITKQQSVETVTSYINIPYAIFEDVKTAVRTAYFDEVKEINGMYDCYKKGAEFLTEGANADYVPSTLMFKKAASIVNKEARFLFSNTPDIMINQDDIKAKDDNTVLQNYIDKVLKKVGFSDKLLKAAKDCFVGKRVACMLNFNEESGIGVTFLKSTQFMYEISNSGDNKLTKITAFYNMVDTTVREEQRYFKKTYKMVNGICYVEEFLYDGNGKLLETITGEMKTLFTYIPATVILNDGLSGDTRGSSEIGYLCGAESGYSKMANADLDALRKSMNPVKYVIDGSKESTRGLSQAPGSFWDITSDVEIQEGKSAQVGNLESSMNYSQALKVTLDRLENNMYAEVDVPNINSEKMQGVITSGKTLKALYWGLTVRCDEKMLAWGPALEFIIMTIITGSKLYPAITKLYTNDKLPDIEYEVTVTNNYPLPEDEQEEKQMDISEINANAMSRKSYLKKWRRLTDDEAEEEILQIKKEQDLFDNASMGLLDLGNTNEVVDANDDEVDDESVTNESKTI